MTASPTQFFDLPDGSGCRMAYRTYTPSSSSARSRTPLYLINGLSAVMVDWSPLFEALGETRPVIISDHRGIGESTTTDEWDQDLSLESMGGDVIDLAHSLGHTTIDLLGFSMGGHITQALLSSPHISRTDPSTGCVVVKDKVHIWKAVLCATMTKLPRGDVNLNALNKEAEKISDKKKRNEFITYNMMKVQYHDDVLGPNGALQSKFEQRLELVRSTNRPAHTIALQFLAIQAADLRPQLKNIPQSVPVMVIHGHKDRMVKYDESDYILKGIPHAKRLADTPSTEFGHFWYEYFPLSYWRDSIANFLDHNKVGGHPHAQQAKL